MNLKTIVIDMDNTMVDTSQAVCDVYNDLYKDDPNFNKIILPTSGYPYNIKNWYLPTDKIEYRDIFESNLLFEKMKPFPGAVEVLKELVEDYGYRIIVCSFGTYKNIIFKCEYLPKVFPFIKEFVPIVGPSKSIINIKNASFIDDYTPNLMDIFHNGGELLRIHRFSYHTYSDTLEWFGSKIPNYDKFREIFINYNK